MAWSTVTLLMITAALTGCGTRAQHPKPLSAWLSYDPVQKTATITLVPAYDNVYGGFNLNGYAKGEVAVIVPVGRRVVVRCANNGTRRPSLAPENTWQIARQVRPRAACSRSSPLAKAQRLPDISPASR